MEISTGFAIANLLWEIYKEISRLVNEAENNPQLNSKQKHIHVEQSVCNIIDGKKICYHDKEALKDLVKNERYIEQQVELEHEKGNFIRSGHVHHEGQKKG
jgi:hypothetical protein